jgi:hypothetical protein
MEIQAQLTEGFFKLKLSRKGLITTKYCHMTVPEVLMLPAVPGKAEEGL